LSLNDFIEATNGPKCRVFENPDPKELIKVLKKLKTSHVITIFALCDAFYKGRAQSTLDKGERLIIIKPDGTLLIHDSRSREPKNWQPPGSIITFSCNNGSLLIKSKRYNPREEIRITCYTLYVVITARLGRGGLSLEGSEKEMAEIINKNPSLIEEGLRIVKREAKTPYGYVDLLGEDAKGRLVVIELKRGIAQINAVYQLVRYVEYFRSTARREVRGIIAAPKISKNAMLILKRYGLEYKRVKIR